MTEQPFSKEWPFIEGSLYVRQTPKSVRNSELIAQNNPMRLYFSTITDVEDKHMDIKGGMWRGRVVVGSIGRLGLTYIH